MKEEIKVPSVGESVTEGVLSAWIVHDGDIASEGDPLFELESDKATLEVPSPVSGKLEIEVEEGSDVEIGQVVARIDTSVKKADPPAGGESGSGKGDENAGTSAGETARKEDKSTTPHQPEGKTSPAARRAMSELGLSEAEITPTGKNGTITKEDAERAAEEKKARVNTEPAGRSEKDECGEKAEQRSERKKMSRIRIKIAENLVAAKRDSAHLTTFNEIDMTNVLSLRKKYQEKFVKAHETKLGILSFFIKASCHALELYPEANSFIDGNEVEYHYFYNIGFAVSTERGLVVPVIRNADKLSLDEIEVELSKLAAKARDKKITVDEMTGGTFSITNGGVFGSLLSTPIPTPPQSAILGMHTIQDRPVAENGKVVIRPMMYVALTYDHRIMDGREAVGFLKSIKESVEDPDKMLLNI